MPIAGAVVVPLKPSLEPRVREKLAAISEVEVQDSGDKGIAVVVEADKLSRLKAISEEISQWEEVIEFSLAYLNWEELD